MEHQMSKTSNIQWPLYFNRELSISLVSCLIQIESFVIEIESFVIH